VTTHVAPTATPEQRETAIARAIEHLRNGDTVALPTETVYGLAADALNVDAALKIFEAKERPRFDPLIVHLPDYEWLERLTEVDARDAGLVRALADDFWPGPLTFVMKRRAIVPDVVTAGLETVAVRISAHPIFSAIVQAFGPLAAPSANRFGRISPTTADHVVAELKGRIPLVVDGGATTHGVESTIVAIRARAIEILRHGPITAEQLAAYAEVRPAAMRDQPDAPGQLPSHYAPRTPLIITDDLAAFAAPTGKRLGALAFTGAALDRFHELRALSASGDLREAAANLFRFLRELDEAGLDMIIAERVPEKGLGVAIMDRLRRAAAR
jgi:L-threonylcarbamoyladenylate synthase